MIVVTNKKGIFHEKKKVGIGIFDLLVATDSDFNKLPVDPNDPTCTELHVGDKLVSLRKRLPNAEPKLIFYNVTYIKEGGISCNMYRDIPASEINKLSRGERLVAEALLFRSKVVGSKRAIYLKGVAA